MNQGKPASTSTRTFPKFVTLAVVGILAVLLLALVSAWFLGSKPVQITLTNPPPNATEIWIDYKLVGKLPGGPNDQFLVVAHAADNYPFQRMVNAKDITAGGKIGLAVPKNDRYRVSIRLSEKGAAISNTLSLKF